MEKSTVVSINDRIERKKRDKERLENATRRAIAKIDSALEIFQFGPHESSQALRVTHELEQTRLRLVGILQQSLRRVG